MSGSGEMQVSRDVDTDGDIMPVGGGGSVAGDVFTELSDEEAVAA